MSTLYLIQIRFSKSFQVQLQAAAVFRIWGTTLLHHTALTQPNHNHILKRNSINATWHISSQVRFQLQLVDCLLYAACQFFRSSFLAKIPQQLSKFHFPVCDAGIPQLQPDQLKISIKTIRFFLGIKRSMLCFH